jgi:hypothetical protein
MSNTNNKTNPLNTKERAKMLYSNVAPIGLEDYQEYRLHDLYTESKSRPAYDMSENCRDGESYGSDMLSCHHKETAISRAFFSERNIQIIQNAIRAAVFEKTKETISEQDKTQILLVMRNIYFRFCKHLPHNVKEQIKDMNMRVLKYLEPLILSEMKQYTTYIQDSFSTLRPQNYPEQTQSAGQRQFSMFPGF